MRSERGYGKIGAGGDNGQMLYAHRVSYELHFGPIPKGMIVCHHCDNPSCVRPEHLFLGTHADNIHDKERKGRGGKQGIHNSQAKLNPDLVRSIRKMRQFVPRPTVAKFFGVAKTTIQAIDEGRTWSHVI